MNYEQVVFDLRDIVNDVTDNDLSESDFMPEMSVLEDVGLNSVDFLELAFEIEKKWEITISDDEFRSVETVDDVIKLILSKAKGESDSESQST